MNKIFLSLVLTFYLVGCTSKGTINNYIDCITVASEYGTYEDVKNTERKLGTYMESKINLINNYDLQQMFSDSKYYYYNHPLVAIVKYHASPTCREAYKAED